MQAVALTRWVRRLCPLACVYLAGMLSGTFPATAHAESQDISLNIYGLAYHPDRKLAHTSHLDNERNPGVGVHFVMRENERGLWFADLGEYRDSGRAIAKLAGPGYQFKLSENWRLGGAAVYFKSRTYYYGHDIIAPVPLLTYQKDRFGLNLTYFPKVRSFNDLAAFVAYATIRLGNLHQAPLEEKPIKRD